MPNYCYQGLLQVFLRFKYSPYKDSVTLCYNAFFLTISLGVLATPQFGG